MQKTLMIAILTILFMTTASGSALAAEASQTQSQEGTARCETETVIGPYGQTTTRCKVDLKQDQTQKIVYVEREATTAAKVHQPADTALDNRMMIASMGTIVSGTGAFIIKLKQRLG